ncbi:VOC family protein [Kordiimonas laminariae]|uniref:VOC family protein n=1 Tax=Kordiimonas laminariae TaxID=2917717 RepID=UPI001FF39C44|nr:VOC family protein [Kordiimonas laminariae]MCK0068691.1 VOC family protein [Kordiimonas laminariae]
MFDHLSTYATDYEKTKAFYETAFKALGHSIQTEMKADWDQDFPGRRMCAFGPEGKPAYWIIEVKEPVSPRHVAFSANNRSSVFSFYEAALSAGGKDNGAPGPRPMYHEHYFGAFVFDPDGNNIEAVCHLPE